MDVYIGELAFLIDNKKRAFADAVVFTIGAKRFGHFAFRMKVAEKIVRDSAEALGPRAIAGNAVD